MKKAIIFDIDTTLTYETSWWKITRDLGAEIKTHEDIFRAFKNNQLTYKDAKNQLIQLWKNTGHANKKFLKRIFDGVKLKDDAPEVINYVKSKNFVVCLITGGVDLYSEVIAEKLKIRNFYANTKLIWNENDELLNFKYTKDQATKKLEQFNHFIGKQKINSQSCYIVGDDENDIKLFQFTKHGIAVKSPNSHLVEPYAWKVITNLSEIKLIV